VQAVLSEAILADRNLARRAAELETEVAEAVALPYPAARSLLAGFRPA
jgi:hypothetical protein